MAFSLCKFYTVEIEVKKITLIVLSTITRATSAFAAKNTAELNCIASAWKAQTVTGLQHKPNVTVVYGGQDITATSSVNPITVA